MQFNVYVSNTNGCQVYEAYCELTDFVSGNHRNIHLMAPKISMRYGMADAQRQLEFRIDGKNVCCQETEDRNSSEEILCCTEDERLKSGASWLQFRINQEGDKVHETSQKTCNSE